MTSNFVLAWGAISVETEGNSIKAESSLHGVAGYVGCDVASLQAVPGYNFDLLYKSEGPPICGRNAKEWTIIRKVRSSRNEIVFTNLEKGLYKVVASIAADDGCEVKRLAAKEVIETRTIVHETSEEIRIGNSPLEDNPHTRNEINSTSLGLNKDNINVFPNPSSYQVFIEGNTNIRSQSIQLVLIDLLGRLHLQQSAQLEAGKRIALDLSAVPNGAYLLQMTNEQGEQYITKLLRIANEN